MLWQRKRLSMVHFNLTVLGGWHVWDLKEAKDRQGQTTILPSDSHHKLHLRAKCANNTAVMILISELTAKKTLTGIY